ncbi:glycosyltransferase family 2 protein [candidate division WWE3 bacterium]|nr:glycosyltransferase family 2 protein [candidate division WWE3 bacterium]
MKVVIVVPTYNEGDNIGQLLPILLEEFKQIPNHKCHVLVVDGNSTDKTQEIVQSFADENPNIHLLVETEKSGIGGAYVKAFKKAMHEMGAEVVMEMDADMQHDPRDVKRFLAEIDNGFDYVIGSRYVDGGAIPQEWGFHRKFLSWGGSMFARIMLGMWSIKDFTTGYKATRVKGILDRLDLDSVLSQGFAYKIDFLYKTFKLGAKIKEIPITFGLRDRGDSKIERTTALDSLKVVLTIRYKENSSFFKFLITGLIGMFFDFAFANLLKFSGIRSGFSASLAALIAMLVTFTLNNNWSFKSSAIKGVSDISRNLVVYIFSSSLPIILRFFIVEVLIVSFGDNFMIYNLALIVSIVIGIAWNYFVYSKFIWKKTNG